MEKVTLKDKLINQFDNIIEDDSKLLLLDGVFDAIDADENDSEVPKAHYDMLNEKREDYLKDATKSKTWDEVKQHIKSQYGL
jgi:hypothetical protein